MNAITSGEIGEQSFGCTVAVFMSNIKEINLNGNSNSSFIRFRRLTTDLVSKCRVSIILKGTSTLTTE